MIVVFSFHVGSRCYDASAYGAAGILSKEVFEMAEMAGFHFNLLDIGGGFPGVASAKPSFEEARHPYLYTLQSGPKKRYPCFNFAITTANVHQF